MVPRGGIEPPTQGFSREAGWTMPGEDQPPNVTTEIKNDAGEADYVLLDSKGFPLCAIEAKRSAKSPLVGKEQARRYADSLKCRFILLSNSIQHYLWDLDQGSPFVIEQFPSQAQLEMRKNEFNPPIDEHEDIENDYVTLTQFPKYKQHPDYLDEENKEDFINKNKLKFLRDYQLNAVHAVQKGIKEGKDRFLLEMATGTGKTLTSTAIMKMFLRLYKVKRVLFLVDRIELENQAKTEFNEILSQMIFKLLFGKRILQTGEKQRLWYPQSNHLLQRISIRRSLITMILI